MKCSISVQDWNCCGENLRKLLHPTLPSMPGRIQILHMSEQQFWLKQTRSQDQGKFLWPQPDQENEKPSCLHRKPVTEEHTGNQSFYFMYMSVHQLVCVFIMCAQFIRRPDEETGVPWNWSYRRFFEPMCVLGTEPMSSGRTAAAFNCWALPWCLQITFLRQAKVWELPSIVWAGKASWRLKCVRNASDIIH